MAPDSEMGELNRALGRIEGRLQAVEMRADRDGEAMQDAMATLLGKVETLTSSIEDLRLSRARWRGGYATLAAVTGGAATLGGVVATSLRLIFPA